MTSTTLDEALTVEILTHLALNATGITAMGTGGDLILAIEGAPGEGKTYHCKTVLGEVGIRIHRFALSDVESPSAGLPSVRLFEAYHEAARISQDETVSVLLVEDVDLALGRETLSGGEFTQRTMNRDLLIGTLMAICDSPSRLKVPIESRLKTNGEFVACRRTPIIITGNDLRRIYPALFRHGRARLVSWTPARSTRLGYIRYTFAVDADAAEQLLDRFPDVTMAFWSSVALEIRRSAVEAEVRSALTSAGLAGIDLGAVVAGTQGPPVDATTISAAADKLITLREGSPS